MSSLYLRIASYALTALLFGVIGWHINGYRWQAKYQALVAGHALELADAQAKAKEALQGQLKQFQATSANNAKVINDLQNQTQQAIADHARDSELVRRLLDAAAADRSGGGGVPQAAHQPAAAPAGEASGDGRLGKLLGDVADECRANARAYNALTAEIVPQL